MNADHPGSTLRNFGARLSPKKRTVVANAQRVARELLAAIQRGEPEVRVRIDSNGLLRALLELGLETSTTGESEDLVQVFSGPVRVLVCDPERVGRILARRLN